MPAPTNCPIAEVDRALSAYINSREDTLRVRRILSRYLTTSLRPVNAATRSQHINHECPDNISTTSTNPPGLKGCRLEYLEALRAHSQAQAKHKELQAVLEDLRQRHVDENPTQAQSDLDDGNTQAHVAFLRQRKRLAELQIIQDSLEQLLAARPPYAHKDLKAVVQESIGEQPNLPAERLDQLSQANDDGSWVFKLKQEVVESRANMDRAKAARASAQDKWRGEASLDAQVYALSCARDEIVEWVQNELAKLEEDSIFLEDASPMKPCQPTTTNTASDITTVEQSVQNAYNNYVSCRSALLSAYTALSNPAPVESQIDDEADKTTEMHAKSALPLTKLLAHIPHLTVTARNDRALTQQAIYLESHLSSADKDMQDTLLRLAGESHLLPAGSKEVAAWGRTAQDTSTQTAEFVLEKVRMSEEEMRGVERIANLAKLQRDVLQSAR
ncbi:hypothetical protein ACEQ8H_005825 [Pleosporales sp. CAS-2024a]